MDYFPIFLNIRDQACLVVGGGDVAARKAGLLAKAGAKITVVSPQLGPELPKNWPTAGSSICSKLFSRNTWIR
jgi:siroheme synthase-like protein